MTQISKATFNTTWADSAGTFADNTSRLISEGDLRQFAQDIKDSVPFSLDASLAQITTIKITISSAELLALNTTPKQLVDAQGAGTYIEVINWTFFLDYNSAAYATNVDLQFIYGSSLVAPALSQAFSPVVQINASADRIISVPSQPFDTLGSNVINAKLGLKVGTGNPTAGNSPLYVYLTYRVITL